MTHNAHLLLVPGSLVFLPLSWSRSAMPCGAVSWPGRA